MLRRYNGSANVDVLDNKRYNGSSWQECEFIRKWNGSAWVDSWASNYFSNIYTFGANTLSTITDGVWTESSMSVTGTYDGGMLSLVPELAFTAPLTIAVDCDFTNAGGAGFYIGSFDANNGFLGGFNTGGTFSRAIKIVSVPYNVKAVRLGVICNTPSKAYTSGGHVYSIKINGISIPILSK